MKLKEIVELLTIAEVSGDLDADITGIKMHSQQVEPGDLFVCVPGIAGFQEDRHRFAEDAVKAGAAAVVVERDLNLAIPTVRVPDARYAMGVICCHFYGYPSHELKLIGVTGTNGKTTTCHMIESIMAEAGFRTGLMGNIGTKIGSKLMETDINTQEPPVLQANLKKMREASTDYCVMEVTSQGLHMGRVLGCEFRTAIFTNVTQDHLDYHRTMENYIAAKGLLFSRMGNAFSPHPSKRKFAVLNADDEASGVFRKVTAAQVLTYGIVNKADVTAKDIKLNAHGTEYTLISFAGTASIKLRMVGTFNVYNSLAAITAALAEQVPVHAIQQGLAKLKSVPGRMEIVDEGQDFVVLVDYAHTPDGLDKALSAVREFAKGRVITVFGCGGNRDRAKRPIMGNLSAKYSDFVIVTSDNPRSENPAQIMEDIEGGFKEQGITKTAYELIEDRRQAITRAIEIAQSGDVVLIAGKGHETYQILKDGTIHFDDREEAQVAIRQRLSR
ncbi:UDP-N-acetylmuramoyl-L-alanyl-D-glutamate--2,6-diaminopimelate ligase [Paenibacillus alkalitolerans]|uniref:UDP-N-acetylmuramoyl-L-alanyl-D-glutamate--2, 6-diaminopimelate ligase n=1 Tax=Paenibacillus alkalitolerans TaxID=2799335 RepID=UPI0018F4508F|nr:UDP-N-acetylmuramoyl-L-alanyl-D-glutamate--2,6-diaminopimelate ligase [Paenibacillus alkalitolerans]